MQEPDKILMQNAEKIVKGKITCITSLSQILCHLGTIDAFFALVHDDSLLGIGRLLRDMKKWHLEGFYFQDQKPKGYSTGELYINGHWPYARLPVILLQDQKEHQFFPFCMRQLGFPKAADEYRKMLHMISTKKPIEVAQELYPA